MSVSKNKTYLNLNVPPKWVFKNQMQIKNAFDPIIVWLLDCREKKRKKEHKTPEGHRQIHKKTSLLFKNFQSRLCYLLGILISVYPLISL